MLKFADVFQDNMVLQRHKPIKLFGTADESCTAEVFINNKKITEAEIQKGKFTITLPEQNESENAELKITAAGESVVFNNVDIGEVWIAGGQSNMEFLMKYEENYLQERPVCNDDHLRFYNVPQFSFIGEEAEGLYKNGDYNKWHSAAPDTLWCFSAPGYYHARKLREELGVPVAILGCNWGGTSATAWMDIETIRNDPGLSVYCEDFKKNENTSPDYAEKEYKNRKVSDHKYTRWVNDMILLGYQDKPAVRLSCTIVNAFRPKNIGLGWQSYNRPAGLYEMMLKKIIGYTVKGVIWYQGESDEHHFELYSKLFSTMICRWRSYWNDNLPFLFVQLAPFAPGQKYHELRHQQEIVENTVDNTYMVTISDIGHRTDIHPKNKHDVGCRLALKALGKIYGKDVVCDAPYACKAETDGNNITLYFENCTKLKIKGSGLNDIRLFSEDGRVKINSCKVNGNTLTLKTENAKAKKTLRIEFAWTPYHEVNLYNEADLPAKPFKLNIR
ncbi:MAG: hypothetical protein IKT61_06210 [Clostridia bacterium]|nr:hypothetical protein [Clostridia bacterium]